MRANLAVKTTQQRTALVTVSVRVADLAQAFGVVGASSVRIPAYDRGADQEVEFIFTCDPETP